MSILSAESAVAFYELLLMKELGTKEKIEKGIRGTTSRWRRCGKRSSSRGLLRESVAKNW